MARVWALVAAIACATLASAAAATPASYDQNFAIQMVYMSAAACKCRRIVLARGNGGHPAAGRRQGLVLAALTLNFDGCNLHTQTARRRN